MGKEIPPLVDDDENYLKFLDSKHPFVPFAAGCAITLAWLSLYWILNYEGKKEKTPSTPDPIAEVQKKSE